MASTSTRPFDSAATVKPQSTDLAKESATERRSAGLALEERKFSLPWTSRIFGPTRSKETMLAAAFLAAVEADIVGAQAGGEAGDVEEIGIQTGDLEVEAAGPLVPIERKVAVDLAHAAGAFLDGRNTSGNLRAAAPALLRWKQQCGQGHTEENSRHAKYCSPAPFGKSGSLRGGAMSRRCDTLLS